MAKKNKSTGRKSKSTKRAAAKKSKAPKYVYYFGDGHADGAGKMKPLLGGKGANLAEMTRIGLPVPPGFTITTLPLALLVAYGFVRFMLELVFPIAATRH